MSGIISFSKAACDAAAAAAAAGRAGATVRLMQTESEAAVSRDAYEGPDVFTPAVPKAPRPPDKLFPYLVHWVVKYRAPILRFIGISFPLVHMIGWTIACIISGLSSDTKLREMADAIPATPENRHLINFIEVGIGSWHYTFSMLAIEVVCTAMGLYTSQGTYLAGLRKWLFTETKPAKIRETPSLTPREPSVLGPQPGEIVVQQGNHLFAVHPDSLRDIYQEPRPDV
ncbi:hypothetical protein TWF696_003449 [Orbilia brochopaga]|uniref:Uncharacterized protein n=1 Tax=Orbilia brochopaga TaxID=3140254 RepID=A0AAV9TWZ0_9PEZI